MSTISALSAVTLDTGASLRRALAQADYRRPACGNPRPASCASATAASRSASAVRTGAASSASGATRPTRPRKGYTCEKALRLDHYQNGRHRLTSPLRRRPDGTFEEIDWDTAIAEVAGALRAVRRHPRRRVDLLLRRRRPGEPPRRRLQRSDAAGARRPVPLQRPGPGEDRRVLGQRQDARRHGPGRLRALPRSRSSSARTRGSRHGIPHARTTLKEIARDPERALIVIDPRRTETAELADIHLPVRPGHRRLAAWPRWSACIVQEGLVDPAVAGRARRRRWTRSRPRSAAVPRRRLLRPLRRRRGRCVRAAARRIAGGHRRCGRVRGPRHPDEPALDAGQLAGEAVWVLTGNFGQARRAVLAVAAWWRSPAASSGGREGQRTPGRRRPDHRRAGALQRDPRGDPHRPPGPLPGHARGERQPAHSLADSAAHARGARVARTSSS